MDNFSSKYLQDKNWKIYKRIIIVNGVIFKLKDLARLSLNERLEFTPALFITLNTMNDKQMSKSEKETIYKNLANH